MVVGSSLTCVPRVYRASGPNRSQPEAVAGSGASSPLVKDQLLAPRRFLGFYQEIPKFFLWRSFPGIWIFWDVSRETLSFFFLRSLPGIWIFWGLDLEILNSFCSLHLSAGKQQSAA
jgi:hypothetical protein